MKKIVIIGGGAAGLMAAVKAAEAGTSAFSENDDQSANRIAICVVEKNAYLGAKVIISGGGRCNVTTGILDVKDLLKNYPRGAKFLMTAMFRFPPEKVIAWFENHGVPMKTESDLRVFPVSDDGKDIVGALEKNLRLHGVEILCNFNAVNVEKVGAKFLVSGKNGDVLESEALILTTGGNAYRHTGSTGDGYAFAQALGHTITHLGPSLSSLVVLEKWVSSISGVSFEKVRIKLGGVDMAEAFERTGAFVFTHRGVSGPAVFALSSLAAHEKIFAEKPLSLTIDFFPDEKTEALDKRIQDLIQKNPQKTLVNFLDIFLPKSLCGVIAELAAIDAEKKAGTLTKQNRVSLIRTLKEFRMTVVGRSAGEEFVTAGGVNLKEINTNTMESKLCPGLFFAGEILDVDGFTGGFNLQAAWATGALAGARAREGFAA